MQLLNRQVESALQAANQELDTAKAILDGQEADFKTGCQAVIDELEIARKCYTPRRKPYTGISIRQKPGQCG